MKNILVPLGTHKNTKNMLQYAIDFAAVFGAKIYVFSAYKTIAKAGTLLKVDDILERETTTFIKEIVDGVDKKNVEIVAVTGKGDVTESVEKIAKSTYYYPLLQ